MRTQKGHIINLDEGYCAEIDQIDESAWSKVLPLFCDATLYQTWSYGMVKWGTERVSHLVVKRHDHVVGLAQVTIKKLPLLDIGIAYVPWGPLWEAEEKRNNLRNLQYTLRAMKEVYAKQRGLLLRISPHVFTNHEADIPDLMKEECYTYKKDTYRTFLLDLRPSLEDLRKGLDQKWRNQLNKAEKNNLLVTEGSTISFYDAFAKLYQEMKGRKQFNTSVDIDQFREVQEGLPESIKLRILICETDEEPIAGLVSTAIGDTGIYLFGATGDRGLDLKGSYLLQWHMIKWLKEAGYRYYDLGGIDPANNPGVYHFKAGLGADDLQHIGQYEFCTNPLSMISVKTGEFVIGLRR